MTTDNSEFEATKFFKFLVWVNVFVLLLPVLAVLLASGNPLTGSISLTLAIIFLPFAMLGLFLFFYNLIVIPMKLKNQPFTNAQTLVLKTIWSFCIASLAAIIFIAIKAVF